VTMVIGKFGDSWKIMHQHSSRFPEAAESARAMTKSS
jgi:hypothetical protein